MNNQIVAPSVRTLLRALPATLTGRVNYTGSQSFLHVYRPEIEHVTLHIAALPAALDGLRLAQISDIHLNEHMQPEQLWHVVRLVNQLAPACVLLTGDYVSERAHYAQGLIEPLRQLQMPSYAVWGNHDYWNGVNVVQRALRETPVQILQNSAVPFRANLWFVGLDDVILGRPDLAAALRDVPDDAVALLLVHEPDYFTRLLAEPTPIVAQCSGHTHGGQIRLPTLAPSRNGRRSWAPVLPEMGRQYPAGLYQVETRHGGNLLYTNRGLGFSGMPLRINCAPEITLFTLRGGDG